MGKKTWLLLLILLLAGFFRFYNLQNWLYFGMDQEYQALIVSNIVSGAHFPLIGVNAADTGLYLGPFFSYFAAIPFAIARGNPVGWAITASLTGILVCYLIFKVGRAMFSERAGIFAALFTATSFLFSFYDRKFWNPGLVPLFSLLIGYLLFKINRRSYRSLIWLALVFGLAVQCHLSILVFVPFILYTVWVNRIRIPRKILLWSLAVFLLLQMPLFIFELRHDFTNSRALINLVTGSNTAGISSNIIERNKIFISLLGRFIWVPSAPDLFLEFGQCMGLSPYKKTAYPEGVILMLVGIGTFIWWCRGKNCSRLERLSFKKYMQAPSFFIVTLFALTFLVIQLYPRGFYEYYLLYLFPWLAIALGVSADFFWRKKHGNLPVIAFFFLYIIFNFLTLMTSSSTFAYRDKIKALGFVKEQLAGKSYSLEAVGECPRFGGYRYLFDRFVGGPVKSYMDVYFSWLYAAKDLISSRPEKIVLLSIIDPRDKPETTAKWEEEKLRLLSENEIIVQSRFGDIRIFILAPKVSSL